MPSPPIETIARGMWWWGDSLLVCQNVKHGYLYLPGGHVEFGESSAEALRREFMEEAALPVLVGPLRAVVEARFVQSGRERHELGMVFHVEQVGDPPTTQPLVNSQEPKIAFAWMRRHQLSGADLRPRIVAEWLRDPSSLDVPIVWLSSDERPGTPPGPP